MKLKRFLSLVTGVAVLLAILLLPLPEVAASGGSLIALDGRGRAALAVLCFTAVLWATDALPLALSSLLGCVLLPVVGATPWSEVIRSGLSGDTIPFVVGISIMSGGIKASGLASRLSRAFVSGRPMGRRMTVLVFLGLGCVISMVAGNMTAAAVMVPTAMAVIAAAEDLPRNSGFARALMIACVWGPIAGSLGTPIGASSVVIAMDFLDKLAGVHISLTQWMSVGVPTALLLILPAWAILVTMFRVDNEPIRCSAFEAGSRLSRTEWSVIASLVVAWGIWMGARGLPVSYGAIAGSLVYALANLDRVRWSDIEESISMATLIVVAAGLAMGSAVYESSAGRWLGSVLFSGVLGMPRFWGAAVTVIIIVLLKTMFSSNAATASLVIPTLISLHAGSAGQTSVWQFVAPAALSGSLSIILVTSCPVNLMAYRGGHFSVRDMAVAGLVMAIAAGLVIAAVTVAFA